MTDADDADIMDVSVSPGEPASGVPVETLRAGLASDDPGVRLHAANVASFVPRDEAETLEAVVPELVALLDADQQEVTIYQSTIALAVLSEEHPEALEPAVERLVELLGHDMSLIRSMSATSLTNVAMDRPALVADAVETLVSVTATEPANAVEREHLDNPDLELDQRESLQALDWEEGVRQQVARDVAANLLVEVATEDPERIHPYRDELVGVLEEGPLSVRTAVADVFAQIAREDPDAAAPAVDALCDLLEYPNVSLVATAVTALGFVGDEAAVEPLRELADDEEREDDLRDLASQTADFIADSGQ